MNTRPFLSILAAALLAGGCNQSETSQPQPPSVKPADPTTQPASLPPGHPPLDSGKSSLPAGHPPLDMSKQTLPAGTGADVANPQWVAPNDWQAGPPSSVRRARFAVNGDSGQSVDIAVTVFPGDVGGMEANINRWRGQIGLAPSAGVATVQLDINSDSATVVDFTNDATGKRMVVVTIPHAGNSWFFKMTGDAPLVEAQKEAFLGFVKSVKF